MIRNYFKIALRNLTRYKGFSFINVVGLGVGMACAILIMLWVLDELSYDRFHAKATHLYRLTAHLPELDIRAAVTPAPMGPTYKAEVPAVKDMVRVIGMSSELMQVADRMFEEKRVIYVDSNFLQVFSFPLVSGDARTALQGPQSILITEAMAKKYFGDENPLGKTILKNKQDQLVVTGVLKNIPSNSHIQFDFVEPMSFVARISPDLKENIWDNLNFYTYVLLDEQQTFDEAKLAAMARQFTDIYKQHEDVLKVNIGLEPLSGIHLYSKLRADYQFNPGDIQYVYIFSIVGIFILIVACVNFMNLATARSARRAKEVGLRKVAGAGKMQLIFQFLSESSLLAIISLVIAVTAVLALLPAFNDFTGKQVTLHLLNFPLIGGLLLMTLIAGLLAGSYPALFLSSFVPASVLKGNLAAGARNATFRNAMVIVQFTISICLLACTGVVYDQLQYVRNKNLGINKDNLVYSAMMGGLYGKYTTLRTVLEENKVTRNFTVVSQLPTFVGNGTIAVDWNGKSPESQPLFANIAVDENFVKIFELKVLAGRGFSKDIASDTAGVMVNESALRVMGIKLEDAIGQPISVFGVKGQLIGVVKDFNHLPLRKKIEPMVIQYNRFGGIVVVRTEPGAIQRTVTALQNIFVTLNPDFPFSYNFIDKDLEKQYASEAKLGDLFKVLAGLAIFISALGLYGLSAFLAERRTKEVGVRKVLGASVSSLVLLLSKTFAKPILVAILIASPLSWYAMDRWLSGFAYHTHISADKFLVAFFVSVGIALVTVSFESIKAALANPARSLKEE